MFFLCFIFFFFFNDTATTEIYTLSLHDAFAARAYNDDSSGAVTSSRSEASASMRPANVTYARTMPRPGPPRSTHSGKQPAHHSARAAASAAASAWATVPWGNRATKRHHSVMPSSPRAIARCDFDVANTTGSVA